MHAEETIRLALCLQGGIDVTSCVCVNMEAVCVSLQHGSGCASEVSHATTASAGFTTPCKTKHPTALIVCVPQCVG